MRNINMVSIFLVPLSSLHALAEANQTGRENCDQHESQPDECQLGPWNSRKYVPGRFRSVARRTLQSAGACKFCFKLLSFIRENEILIEIKKKNSYFRYFLKRMFFFFKRCDFFKFSELWWFRLLEFQFSATYKDIWNLF